MKSNELNIGFTGHRPDKLNNEYDYFSYFRKSLRCNIYTHIESYYRESNNITFYTGMALGFDIDCAASVIKLRRKYADAIIKLIAVIPSPKQNLRWDWQDKQIYANILSRCDELIDISAAQLNKLSCNLFQARNEYIVDHVDRLLYLWDGKSKGGTYNCLQYARKQETPVDCLRLSSDILKELRWCNVP